MQSWHYGKGLICYWKANFFLAEILAYNKSALCRSASPAFSFVLFQTLSDLWLQHLFNLRSSKRNHSVYIYELRGQFFLVTRQPAQWWAKM